MAQGSSRQDGGVAKEVRGHRHSFPSVAWSRVLVTVLIAVADDGEEDVLEGRLLLDVFDLGRREQLLELGEGAVHLDPALVKDRDPVGELFGLVEVLRREQHRRPLLGELLDGLPHLDAPLGVEPVRRLVEEDHRRIPDETHRDVETATHPARIGRHPPRGSVGQPETIEQVIRDRAWVLEVPQAGDQHEVLSAGEDLVDGCELARETERLPDVRSLRGDIEAVDDGGPRVGPEQGRQDPDDRGLARPVRAEQGEDAAPRHVEVDAAQDLQLLVRLLEALHVDRGPLDLLGCHALLRSCYHRMHTP